MARKMTILTGPMPLVDSVQWAKLIENCDRPQFIPVSTWKKWKLGVHAPPMSKIKSLVSILNIAEKTVVSVLGWSEVPISKQRLKTSSSDDVLDVTIDDVLTWLKSCRRLRNNADKRKSIKKKLNGLNSEERLVYILKTNEAARERALVAWEIRHACENIRRRGFAVPRLPNGMIDKEKVYELAPLWRPTEINRKMRWWPGWRFCGE